MTRIGLPSPAPASFSVQAQADWLGLVAEILDAAAAIIPDTEVAQAELADAADKVATDAAQAGQQAVSTSQALQQVDTELKVEKGPAFETADAFSSAYGCLSGLSSSVQSASLTKLAAQVKDCLKEIFPSATTDATDYLKALIGFIQLPAVLNDFREHGRQVYAITAMQAPPDGTYRASSTRSIRRRVSWNSSRSTCWSAQQPGRRAAPTAFPISRRASSTLTT